MEATMEAMRGTWRDLHPLVPMATVLEILATLAAVTIEIDWFISEINFYLRRPFLVKVKAVAIEDVGGDPDGVGKILESNEN